MNPGNRILIAEDRTLVRQGLEALLAGEPDFAVIDAPQNARDILRLRGALRPDLVLIDLPSPATGDTARIAKIKQCHPNIRVLVLAEHRSEEHVREALKAGADGYVLKHATRAELMHAIRSILAGKTYLSPDIAEKVVNGYLDAGTDGPTALERLTLREREVLELVAAGRANRHIANHLRLSVKTVEKHRANLMKKLGLHNVAALTAFAIEKGMA